MIRRCPRQYCLHSLARIVSHSEIRRPTNSRHVAAADAALDVTVNETFMLDVFGLSDLHTHEVRNGSTQIKGQVKSGIKTQNSPSYGKTCSSTGWLVEGGRSSTGRARAHRFYSSLCPLRWGDGRARLPLGWSAAGPQGGVARALSVKVLSSMSARHAPVRTKSCFAFSSFLGAHVF